MKETKLSDRVKEALDKRNTDDEAVNNQVDHFLQKYKAANNIQELRTVRHEVREVIRKVSVDSGKTVPIRSYHNALTTTGFSSSQNRTEETRKSGEIAEKA